MHGHRIQKDIKFNAVCHFSQFDKSLQTEDKN